MQAARVKSKSSAFTSATERVASGLQANEALTYATAEGRRKARSSTKLADAAQAGSQVKAQADKKCFYETLATTKLRDVARAQAETLKALRAEKLRWVQRSFPSFATVHRTGCMPGPQR